MNTHPPIDTLIHASWILTQNPQRQVLRDFSLAITEGKISAILPRADAQQRTAKTHIDLPGHALMPGLINMHGHAAMTLFRGLADDLPLNTWLKQHIWPAENALLDPEFVSCGTSLAIAEMLRSGTTCYADHYLFPEASIDPIQHSGIRAHLFCPIIDVKTNWSAHAQAGIDSAIALQQQVANHPKINIGLGPHAPYTVSDESLKRVRDTAQKHQLFIQIHLHETEQEVAQSQAQYGMRPIARLQQLGILGPQLQCVHMVALNDDDLNQVAAAGAGIVHCPESNLKLASGFCPVQQILEHDIPLALGTDGAASNNDLDLISEMRTAALIAKATAQDAEALSAQQVFDCATLSGARMLGQAHRLGSLEVGKEADVVALDWRSIELQPIYNPISQLVYATQREQVVQVWIGGQRVLQDRQPCGIHLDTLKQNILHYQQSVQRVIQGAS